MDLNEIAINTVTHLATHFPFVTSALVVIGVARVVNKPLLALAKAYVEKTESKKDDEILVTIESSKIYKAISFLLDWSVSIKLPPKKVAVETLPEEKKTA